MKRVLHIENIPEELKKLDQWVMHREKNLRTTTGGQAKVNEPRTWTSFESVVDTYMFSDLSFDGIGFVFTSDDPFCGIDLDKCIKSDGSYSDTAKEFLEKVPHYAEMSPSEKGLHIIARAKLPGGGFNNSRTNGVEMYDTGHYFTFTGSSINAHNTIPNTPIDVSELWEKYRTPSGAREVMNAGDIFANLKAPAHGWTVEKIREKITPKLDPNMDRDKWIRCGMALHHQFDGAIEGLQLWDEWSSQATRINDKGPVYKVGECERLWKSFNSTRANTFTLASLIQETNAKLEPEEKIEEQLVQPIQLEMFADIKSLAYQDPPAKTWAWDGFVPEKCVTALYGRGGIGKSVLSLQLGICVANGIPLFDIDVTRGRVLAIYSEDDNNDILIRCKKIFEHYELDPEKDSDNLDLWGSAGVDQLMLGFDRTGKKVEHMPFKRLEQLIKQEYQKGDGYSLIILDNIGQIFGGDEIKRSDVTSFVAALTGLCKQYECSIFLIGHTAKAEGSEFSGSTAWDASLRSRLLINMNEDDTTTLKNPKSNYSKTSQLLLKMEDIVFKKLDDTYTDVTIRALKDTIKNAINEYNDRKQHTSHSKNATNYIVKHMVEDEKIAKHQKKKADECLKELIADEEVLTKQKVFQKDNRHWATGLSVVGEVPAGDDPDEVLH